MTELMGRESDEVDQADPLLAAAEVGSVGTPRTHVALNYATLPRSATASPRSSPFASGASTPHLGSLNKQRSLPSLTSTAIDIPSLNAFRNRVAERLGDRAGESSSRLDDARYEDLAERTARQGDPQSWGVLAAAVSRSYSLGPCAAGGGAARRPGARKASQGRNRISDRATLQEEPASYAATTDHVDGDSGGEADGYGRADESGSSTGPDSETEASDDDEPPSRERRSTSELRLPTTLDQILTRLVPIAPVVRRDVLKCVLAYFVASLFTYIPILSDFVGAPWDVDGPVRNAHAIATVSVYFMPARTIGGLLELDVYLSIGAVYAVFLTTSSMAFSVLCEKLDALRIGHFFVLSIWIGGGYGLMAFVKVARAKPTISTACSLVSLVCSPIITKEGAYHAGQFNLQVILQILLIAGIGSICSNLVCLCIWPRSATSELQTDLNRTLTSFSTLIDSLTKTFLLEDLSIRPETLKKAIDAHQASFTTLKTSLSQAKFEIFDSRMSGTTETYDQAVSCMTRLAQGLTGMRAGCALQLDLLRASDQGGAQKGGDGKERSRLEKEKIVIETFRARAGPSLRHLAHTSRQVLAMLKTSFVQTRAGAQTRRAMRQGSSLESGESPAADSLLRLRAELEQSLTLFRREHSRAVKILYRSLPSETVYDAEDLDMADPFAESGGLADNSSDDLFRIYHFCFNFEEWAVELLDLVAVFVELRSIEENVARHHLELERRWRFFSPIVKLCHRNPQSWRRSKDNKASIRHQFARALRPPHEKRRNYVFPEIVDGALTSHVADDATLSPLARIKRAFWRLGWYLRQPNVRFGIKTGAGAALLASPAFVPTLRPLWLRWRGEWSLISYMVIMAPSLGATNFLALGRVLGTALGAGVAVACYAAFPENAIVLPVLGAIFSAPCFCVAVTKPQFAPSSRFVLLTYNLTTLYAFNLREADVPIVSIAFHRSVSVAFGVLYGLVVSGYVWPFEARRELRKALAEYFINTSHLYERLVRTYSAPPPSLSTVPTRHDNALGAPDERTSLLGLGARRELDRAADDFVAMEVQLQLTLIRVTGLLAATPHEPRLKGPFPVAAYRQIVTSCQTILDTFTSVARMTHREAWLANVRRDFIMPVNAERREMVGNVVLYFSLLASAVSLKSPLPPYLPPAAEVRERLVQRLHRLEVVQKRLVRGGSDSLLYLAYVLSMKDIIAQLDLLGRTFQDLFGIVGGTTVEDFESLFVTDHAETFTQGGPPLNASQDTRQP